MNNLPTVVDALDWQRIHDDMNKSGFALVPGFLKHEQCRDLIQMFEHQQGYRKTVVMERYRFGSGCYKYWDYPLPDLLHQLRVNLYPRLAPIANAWMKQLRIAAQFPHQHEGLRARCHEAGQTKPTSLILRYGEGGFNTLHQDLYGDVYFPIQVACFLNQPGEDFTGGEFVLTEQIPRAQSKAVVLTPNRGDMIIFTTRFRPVEGSRGFYRANMRHGVSEVRSGCRHAVGIIFHDATS